MAVLRPSLANVRTGEVAPISLDRNMVRNVERDLVDIDRASSWFRLQLKMAFELAENMMFVTTFTLEASLLAQ